MTRIILGVSILALSTGCLGRGDAPGEGEAKAPLARKLRSLACSDIDVSVGIAQEHWIVESESENLSPSRSMAITDLWLGSGGTLYVVDKGEARVTKFDARGGVLAEWGRTGSGPGEFRSASAIAVGADRRVYVADQQNSRITVFSDTGDLIRTLSVARIIDRVEDLIVLSNGNLVIAKDLLTGEDTGGYVVMVDSAGNLVRTVLSGSRPEAGRDRPLLGHNTNLVRLSLGPADQFAVWYPMDNYVEMFDSTGLPAGRIQGCLHDDLKAAYGAQREANRRAQTLVVITIGVQIDSTGDVRVASYYRTNDRRIIRIRRYANDGTELTARDYEVSRFASRIEFPGNSALIGFDAGTLDWGIVELSLQ